MSSVSKASNIKFTIIRRSDSARKNSESIAQIDISNKDDKLDNKFFNDLVHQENQKKDDKPSKDKNKSTNKGASDEDISKNKKDTNITDFYV
jgi:hypothetical protein